eukprot:202873-Amphidinium_carterae.1
MMRMQNLGPGIQVSNLVDEVLWDASMLPTTIGKEHFVGSPSRGCLLRTGERTGKESAKSKHPNALRAVVPWCRNGCLLSLRLKGWAVVENVRSGAFRFPTVWAC